jgi:hypothetical protein
MSCICGFATIATLIVLVLAAVPPIAEAASDATKVITAMDSPAPTFTDRRELSFRAFCMVNASSERMVAARRACRCRSDQVDLAVPMRDDNVVKQGLSSGLISLYD